MKQLLMKWNAQQLGAVELPEGYHEYRFTRGGDEVFTEEKFKKQWIDIRDKNHSEEQVKWFYTVYDDMRVPDDGFFCVLDKDGTIVATAHIQLGEHTPDSATVHAVAASEEHRGKKLGKAVTVMVMRYAFEKGIKELYLTTDDWRTAAVNLYIRLEFMPVMYEDDMRERWTKLIRENGYENVAIIDEEGNYSFI